MSNINVSWAGTESKLKSSQVTQNGEGITEYVEVWTGNPLSNVWPSYALGGAATTDVNFKVASVGNLKWYSIDAERGQSKALATYTARASDRYDEDKAIWQVEYSPISGVETIPAWVPPMTFYFSPTFYGYSPILSKTSWRPHGDALSGFGVVGKVEDWPDCPIPFTPVSATLIGYAIYKSAICIQKNDYGFQVQEQWKYAYWGSMFP